MFQSNLNDLQSGFNLQFRSFPFDISKPHFSKPQKSQMNISICSLNSEINFHHNAFWLWVPFRGGKKIPRISKASLAFPDHEYHTIFVVATNLVWFFCTDFDILLNFRSFQQMNDSKATKFVDNFSVSEKKKLLIELLKSCQTITGFHWIFYSLWAIENKCATTWKA